MSASNGVEVALGRLADAMARHRRVVLAAWLLILVLAVPLAARQTGRLSGGGWTVPGSASAQAAALLRSFPGHQGDRFAVFVQGRTVEATDSAVRKARTILARDPELAVAPTQTLAGGRAAMIPAGYLGDTADVYDYLGTLRKHVVADTPVTSTRVVGEDALWSNFQTISKQQLAKAETLGFPFILAVLLLAFGTVFTALAPLAVGVVAITVTGAVVFLLAGSIQLSIYVTNVASMIGIGVAVDYSLFVVSRYRAGLAGGAERADALRTAMQSAGTAVVFSGATVVVSLASLLLVDVNAVRSMALGAVIVVSVAVVGTCTLLPALLALVGKRAESLRVRLPRRVSRHDSGDAWRTWSDMVMRRPLAALLLAVGVIAVLSAPLLAITTRSGAFGELPANSEVRAATERLAQVAGPASTGPVEAILPTRTEAAQVAAQARTLPGVADVRAPVRAATGEHWLVEIVPSSGPDSAAAQQLLDRVRALGPRDVLAGGVTAANEDINRAVFGRIWQMILLIVGCSFVVLLFLLRSVILPVKAVIMNVLSVAAAYGVLVAVFQWGWFNWTGYHAPGYVDTIVPVLLLATTFGLSMDYEVFLLTRIRERYLATGDTRSAVAEGLAASARTITAAALIMVVVFGAFAFTGALSIKELGVGLATAITVDATLVRLLLVPAAMRLLGRWNWWLPQPLARLLLASGPAVDAAL